MDGPARLEFVDGAVDGPLRGVIGSMVGYRATGAMPSLHRGVPSPSLTLIVNLDTPIVVGEHAGALADGSARAYENILGSLHVRPAYVFQPSRQAGIQLALHPLAARRLVGVPVRELSDLSTDAADVLGEGIRLLQERIADQAGWPQRFATVERYLLDRAGRAPSVAPARPEVSAAWRWMVANRGRGRMDDLARHVLLSGRQLTRVFRAEFGVTPKAVNRLIRFDRARRIVQSRVLAGRAVRLADIAQETGYFDHAHLVREFHGFLGCSPTDWLAEEVGNIQAGGHRHGEDLRS
ncbi:helix-turn-helix domain-containing protein [Pseudactinotalea sp. HY158]|uniref:AraC family transcriptional regulator n=1 Tax=Pseudactinotalea sp. HY158 TaxID=2654547 RepID=UPI00129CF98F|nr:helix-turn-helix domain-containing protein [Pseudactinotalea sp. HY158]QGH69752.1 helix-turn-helix domain-containing protein [Pseudactinotalea sp. HY158]